MERKALVEREDSKIPVSMQAELLGLNRSGLYYQAVPPTEEDLRIKRMIDELYTAHPEFGYRRMQKWLEKDYHVNINHKAVYRHMREMGIQAVGCTYFLGVKNTNMSSLAKIVTDQFFNVTPQIAFIFGF